MLLTLLFKICPYMQCGLISILIVAGLALVGVSLFQCVSMPAATAIPSSNGGIIIISSDANAASCITNIVNNGSHNGRKQLKKAQKLKEMMTMKTMTKKQTLPPGGVTKTNVCIVPLLTPQQPHLEHHRLEHHRHREEEQQLLQKHSSTLLLPEFMT